MKLLQNNVLIELLQRNASVGSPTQILIWGSKIANLAKIVDLSYPIN